MQQCPLLGAAGSLSRYEFFEPRRKRRWLLNDISSS